MNPEDMLRALASVQSLVPTPVKIEKADTRPCGTTAEYIVGDDRLQVHFWPEKGKPFPKDFRDRLTTATANFPPDRTIIDWVPEVGSWYLELRGLPFAMAPPMIEHLLKKIGG
ncbi:MAG: hypothetical protein ACOYOB_20790 [Myxococcota bacterium]